MSSFLIDKCIEASDTDIASHTPDTGGVWDYISGFWHPGGLVVIGGAGYADTVHQDGDQLRYGNRATPPSADYGVRIKFQFVNAGAYCIAEARADLRGAPLADWLSYYRFRVFQNGTVDVEKMVSNSVTTLNTSSGSAFATGVDHTMDLRVSGTTLTAILDGSTFWTGTDSGVASAGVASMQVRDVKVAWIQAGNPADADPEGGIVITGPLAGGGRTHSTLTQGRLAP